MTDDLRAKIAELRRLEQAIGKSEPGFAYTIIRGRWLAASTAIAPLLAAEVERLAAENERLRAACRMVLDRWTFSNQQVHTHTWHDWADCKEAIDVAMKEGEP